MKGFKGLLAATATLVIAGAGGAQAPTSINADAVRTAPVAGPLRITATPGFSLNAGAPTTPLDLIDVNPGSNFIIEGPVSMAIEGLEMVAARCAVYSGDRPIAAFDRTAPVFGGAFAGRFRFGLVRTAEGAPTAYACWVNAFGTRGGANWWAYEEPNAALAGGYAQWVKMADGGLWTGAPFAEQVVLHFSGPLSLGGVPNGPGAANLERGLRIPDGSNAQWRPPIIPPGYGAQLAGTKGLDWRSMQDLFRPGDSAANCTAGCAGIGEAGRAPPVVNTGPQPQPGKVN